MTTRVCFECDGDGVVVARVRYDEVRGGLMYDTVPCPECRGTGEVVLTRRVLVIQSLPAILVVVLAVLFIVWRASGG